MADVRQIMADLLQRSGIPVGQLDVDAVQGVLGGVVLGEQASIRQALEQLQGFFQLDSVEQNGTLAFIPRGKASVLSITEAELLGRAEEVLSIERLAEPELPEQLDVVYLDPASDYQASVQTSLRQTSFSKKQAIVENGVGVRGGSCQATSRCVAKRSMGGAVSAEIFLAAEIFGVVTGGCG